MTKRAVFFLIGYIATAVILFVLNPASGQEGTDYHRFVSGFDITYNGETSHNRQIDEVRGVIGREVVRGEVIELSHILTNAGDLLFPAVSFSTADCAVEVLMDDEVCYTAGFEAYEEGEAPARAVHIADLGMDYADRLMTIRLTAAKDGADLRVTPPLFGEQENVTRAVGNPLTSAYFGGAFLMLFGLSSLIAIMVFYFRLRRFETQVFASLLSAAAGLWLLGMVRQQAYALPALFWTLPLLYGYILLLPKKMPKRMPKKVLQILAASGSGLSILFFLLQITGAVKGPVLAIPYILLLAAALVAPVMVSYEDITERRFFSPSSMQLLGVMSLSLLLMAGAAVTASDSIGTVREIFLRYAVPVLMALYLAAQTYRYTAIIYESQSTHSENEVLYRVAYEDPLTALYNRAGWDEKMKQLADNKEPYCVISMDLDGLKAINDTQGHQAGDKLIKGFAKALTESFPERYFLSRIGGDEFCVIMEDVPEAEVKRCLNRMELRLAALDRKEKHINHRCSYGYAIKTDDAQTAHELYLTADERMYAMKQQHKAAKKADAMVKADSTEAKVAQMVEETLKKMQAAEVAQGAPETMSATQSLVAAAQTATAPAQAQTQTTAAAPQPAPPHRTDAQARAALRKPLISEQRRKAEALQRIKQQEIAKISKQNTVKKALKVLEEAQKGDKK